jgi:hypothetical protein
MTDATLMLPPRTVSGRSADADAHMPVGGAVGAVVYGY